MALRGAGDSKSHVFAVLSVGALFADKELFTYLKSGLAKWFLRACISLFVVSFIAYLFSSTTNVGWNLVMDFLLLAVWFMASVNYFSREKEQLMWLFKGLGVLAVLGFLIGGYAYITHPFDRFAGPFMNLSTPDEFYPNLWADFCLMMFGAGVYLFWKGKKWLGSLVVTLMSAGVFLSYSRGGWIALAVIMILLLIRNWRLGLKVLLLVVLGFLVGEVINLLREEKTLSLVDKLLFRADEGTTSVSARGDYFKGAIEMFKQEPWWGFGPDSFRYIFPRFQSGMLAFAPHPHNIVLKYAAELGIFAVISLGGMMLLCGYQFVKGFMKMDEAKFAVGLSLIAVFAHQMIDYTFVLVMLILVAVYLGIFFSGAKSSGKIANGIYTVLIFAMGIMLNEGYLGLQLKNGDYEAGLEMMQADYAPVGVDRPEEMVSSFPNNAELWVQWGDELEGEEALEKYLMAYKLDPKNNLGIYRRLCESGYEEIDYEGVAREYLELLQRNAFYTALTGNPEEAYGLAECVHADLLAEEIWETWELELSKLQL